MGLRGRVNLRSGYDLTAQKETLVIDRDLLHLNGRLLGLEGRARQHQLTLKVLDVHHQPLNRDLILGWGNVADGTGREAQVDLESFAELIQRLETVIRRDGKEYARSRRRSAARRR